MKLTQILLFAGIAIVMTIALMSLPKAVVVNDKSKAEQQAPSKADSSDSTPSFHGPAEAANQPKADSLIALLAQTQDKIAVLDQLCEVFQDAFMYDSCAYYTEKTLGVEDRTALQITSIRYFEAFQYSKDPMQGEALAIKAKALLEKSVAETPEILDNKVRLGITKALTETPPMQGIFMIKSALDQDPKNKLALKYLGIFSIRSGQLDKAVERLTVLSEVDPSDYESKLMLGTALSELGRNENAKEILLEIVNNSTRKDIVQSAQEILVKIEREIPASNQKPNS